MKQLAPLLALAALGCSPAAVDYAALEKSASSRQRWSDAQAAATSRDVARLLARPLTADTAARVALANNRGVRAATEELGIAQAELASVKRLPNPTLEAALRFHGEGDPEIELGAMLDISELLLALSRSGASTASVAAAKLEAVGALVDLSFEARRAFIDVQAALELVELRQTVQRSFEASALAAERLRAAGNVTPLTLASEQALREEATLELQLALAEMSAARERLNVLMGVFGGATAWQVKGRLAEIPPRELATERLERDALLASLDLAAAKERYVAAAKHAGVAGVSGWLPELKAGVSAERAEGEWGIGPAVELELPLFYQGQGEAGVARARAKQSEHSYADLAVRIRSAARAARIRLEAARSGALRARDVILPLRQKVVEQTLLEYNGMLVGVFELLQAKRQQLAAAEEYLALRRQYWQSRLDAEQLLAGRLGSAVDAFSAGSGRTSPDLNGSDSGH
jgi:cobalt-zinc-cadmium efflux system outer membrane protein